jgi:hypothetical protein
MSKRILYTVKHKQDEEEVRHLLLDSIDGAHTVVFSEMANGVETELARGTQYEMEGKARERISSGNFQATPDDEKVFEALRNTVALASACGYRTVYDGRNKSALNIVGQVPLSEWRGMEGKNGGGYEYALDGMKILARPTLPPNHGLNMKPATNQECLEVIREASKILESVGPAVEFVLGGHV